MAKSKIIWVKKKVPGNFRGHYVRDADNERNFILKKDGGGRRITFESHEAAKTAGWKKK